MLAIVHSGVSTSLTTGHHEEEDVIVANLLSGRWSSWRMFVYRLWWILFEKKNHKIEWWSHVPWKYSKIIWESSEMTTFFTLSALLLWCEIGSFHLPEGGTEDERKGAQVAWSSGSLLPTGGDGRFTWKSGWWEERIRWWPTSPSLIPSPLFLWHVSWRTNLSQIMQKLITLSHLDPFSPLFLDWSSGGKEKSSLLSLRSIRDPLLLVPTRVLFVTCFNL